MIVSPADLIFSYRWNMETMQKLVSDVDDSQMTAQKVEGINHPAWLLGHVSIYNPVIAALLRGESFGDPWGEPCGKNSSPVADRSQYPSKDAIIERLVVGYRDAVAAMESADPKAWTAPFEHPTWGKQFATVAPAVTFIATTHFALHLGQLSGWRRTMQLPRI